MENENELFNEIEKLKFFLVKGLPLNKEVQKIMERLDKLSELKFKL